MYNIAIVVTFILLYYSYGKKAMIYLAEHTVKNGLITSQLKVQELKGIIELIFIVISHLLFCYFLASFLRISLKQLWHPSQLHWHDFVLGILLGTGQMVFSATLCLLLIHCLQFCVPKKVPSDPQEWAMQSRSGWIRHHLDTIRHLPKVVAIGIITLQIAAEETVFRGLLFTMLLPWSKPIALYVSSFLFSLIQVFLMPRKITSLFPVIGALVMGLSNAYLFMHLPNLFPLIIAHVFFFFISLLT